MECRKLLEELSNYIDHNIDPGVCDEIEKHIDGCSPCQVFIETLRETVKIFKENCPQKDVPEKAKARLRERLLDIKKSKEA
jgi:mycothiol system anti-sigma-R factor